MHKHRALHSCTRKDTAECMEAMQGMLPTLSMLRGIAIQEDTGSNQFVKLFDVAQLPSEPAARFKAVFQENPTWLWQDLQPYIEDLQVCLYVSDLSDLLTKCHVTCYTALNLQVLQQVLMQRARLMPSMLYVCK